ncbi:MAG: hypothetical protein WCF67_00215 [Chitinophagaceae bacterium]
MDREWDNKDNKVKVNKDHKVAGIRTLPVHKARASKDNKVNAVASREWTVKMKVVIQEGLEAQEAPVTWDQVKEKTIYKNLIDLPKFDPGGYLDLRSRRGYVLKND